MNEADFQQKNWQTGLYDGHYNKLKYIKKKYDPDKTFRASVARPG